MENPIIDNIDIDLITQIILLSRFTKQRIRRGFSNFPELENEEFTYLYLLMKDQLLTKMQLIERNANEKQTGITIISRMVLHGLIKEIPDNFDKRLKRLKVTKKGVETFYKSLEYINEVSQILGANLNDTEKENLIETLNNINKFQFKIYNNYRDLSNKEIIGLI